MMARMKRWAGRTAAILLGLALVLGGMEAVMRSQGKLPVQRNPLRGFHTAHPTLGWLGVPNYEARFSQGDFDVVVKHDGDGFRLPDHGITQFDDNARRIAILGDSFTWGWGVPQGAVFSDPLQKGLGRAAQLRNFGVNAFGTGQQLALLREFALPWKPDAVILMVFGNDLRDNIDEKGGKRPYYRLVQGDLVPENTPVRRKIDDVSRALSRSSVAISMLHYEVNKRVGKWKEGRRKRLALAAAKEAAAEKNAATAASELPGDGPGTQGISHSSESEAAVVDAYEADVFQALLAEFKSTCAQSNPSCELWVVYVPERHEVVRGFRDVNGDSVQHSCEALGLPFLDLTTGLHAALPEDPRLAERGLPLYLPHDMHWNVEGHRVAASLIQDTIPF